MPTEYKTISLMNTKDKKLVKNVVHQEKAILGIFCDHTIFKKNILGIFCDHNTLSIHYNDRTLNISQIHFHAPGK